MAHLGPEAREKRVIVVAHSLGGLVARYWAGVLDGWRMCRAVITLGTPHRGGPKALDVLANGVRIGPVALDGTTAVLREWPSVAELLPRYPAVWDQSTDLARYPHELPLPASSTVVSGWLARRYSAASQTRWKRWCSVYPYGRTGG